MFTIDTVEKIIGQVDDETIVRMFCNTFLSEPTQENIEISNILMDEVKSRKGEVYTRELLNRLGL